jgi:hypothetical protein
MIYKKDMVFAFPEDAAGGSRGPGVVRVHISRNSV